MKHPILIREPATVLSVRRTGFNRERRTMKFLAVFDKVPDSSDVQQAQVKAGYHPCGYGGPFRIHNASSDGLMVTFECSDSCD